MKFFFRSALTALAAVAALSSCNKEDKACPVDTRMVGNQPITLNSNIRINPLKAHDATWDTNDKIGVYMVATGVDLDKATPEQLYYENKVYTTAAGGEGTVQFKAATDADKMFFPKNEAKVDFIAFWPQATPVSANKTIDINTAGTQPGLDLLYSNSLKGKNSTAVIGDLVLTFRHVLSAVRIELRNADNTPLTGATLKLEGFKTKSVFSLTTGKHSNIDTPADMTLTENSSKPAQFNAFVIPQTLTGAKIVVTAAGKTYSYKIADNTNYADGKRTTYVLKLKDGSLVEVPGFNGTITDWDDLDPINGELTPDNPSSTLSMEGIAQGQTIDVPAEAAVKSYAVTSNAQTWSVASSDETVVVASKDANNVKLDIKENTTATARTATVTITYSVASVTRSGETKSFSFTINQAAKQNEPQKELDGGLAAILAKYPGEGTITEDVTIRVVRTSGKDNMNGLANLYLGDSKAGVMVRLKEDKNVTEDMNKSIPMNKIISINLKNKSFTLYKKTQQLSLSINDLVITDEDFILEPIVFDTPEELIARRTEMNNRLVTLRNVQFSGWKEGNVYNHMPDNGTFHGKLEKSEADGASGISAETSKYAPWINAATPGGNGSITGVFVASGKFNNIWYRTLDDIQFTGARK